MSLPMAASKKGVPRGTEETELFAADLALKRGVSYLEVLRWLNGPRDLPPPASFKDKLTSTDITEACGDKAYLSFLKKPSRLKT